MKRLWSIRSIHSTSRWPDRQYSTIDRRIGTRWDRPWDEEGTSSWYFRTIRYAAACSLGRAPINFQPKWPRDKMPAPFLASRRSSRCSLTKQHRTEFGANVINGPTTMSQASSRNMRKLSLITDYSARARTQSTRNSIAKRRNYNETISHSEMQFYPVSRHILIFITF